MNKKLITLVIILIIFIVGLTEYKYKERDKKHYFVRTDINELKDNGPDLGESIELYDNKIIKDDVLSLGYNLSNKKGSIKGQIYIAPNKYLYISNDDTKEIYNVSSTKFRTLYYKDYEYLDGIYVYLISEDDKLYLMSLEDNDIHNTNIFDYQYKVKIKNFVDIELKHDKDIPGNSLFVLGDDNIIFDANTGILYDSDTISLYNSIYVYQDKTMSSVYGREIKDKEGNPYKIKYIFDVVDSNGFIKESNPIVIITENNEFIYFDKDIMHVYEFDKLVKDIKYDKYEPYEDGKLEITFEDNYKVNFTAKCNEYFCLNKFNQ